MAQNSGQEKTEQATPKRRKDARKEGNVFQSRDVSTVAVLIGVFFLAMFFFPYLYKQMRLYMVWLLERSVTDGENLLSAHPRTFRNVAEMLHLSVYHIYRK